MNSYPLLDCQPSDPLDDEIYLFDSVLECRYCGESRIYIPARSYIAEDARTPHLAWFDHLLPCWHCRLWRTSKGDT